MNPPAKRLTYSAVGVDVAVEAQAAKILYKAARRTWDNRKGKLGEVISPLDDFSGLKFIRVDGLPKGTVLFGGSDGVATKAEFAERAGRYDTLAFDLMAMVCDDAVIRGGEPMLVKSVLDVNTLGKSSSRLHFIEELAKGYVRAAKEAGVAVINGEIAQLNNRSGRSQEFSLDWSADVTWFAHESRLISGKSVVVGDYVVGLRETGLRCNGISLVRQILRAKHDEKWHQKHLQGKRLVDWALQPSKIYAKAVVAMFGGYNLSQPQKANLHAAAHITGGGIPEKLGRALRPSGLGANITEPYAPGKFMQYCQKIGDVKDNEAYRTWHMGQGMILITPSYQEVIDVAAAHGLEAKVIGQVMRDPFIKIVSRGTEKPGQTLSFDVNL